MMVWIARNKAASESAVLGAKRCFIHNSGNLDKIINSTTLKENNCNFIYQAIQRKVVTVWSH